MAKKIKRARKPIEPTAGKLVIALSMAQEGRHDPATGIGY